MRRVYDMNIPVVHVGIRSFDKDQHDFIVSHKVKMFSPILYFPLIVVDAMPIKNYNRDLYPESVINCYNRIQPWLQRIFGEKSASCLITSDKSLCKLLPLYKGVMIVVIKELACWRDRARVRVRPSDIFKIFVPYYHMPSTNR